MLIIAAIEFSLQPQLLQLLNNADDRAVDNDIEESAYDNSDIQSSYSCWLQGHVNLT